MSEIGWYTDFFDRYFPVLGSNFGLGILGIFQCLSVLLPSFLSLFFSIDVDSETNHNISFPFPGYQPKSYLTSSRTSPSSPPLSFSSLGVSTFSSVSSSVNQPKLNAPLALGAPDSGVISQLPRTIARFSSLLSQSFHLGRLLAAR